MNLEDFKLLNGEEVEILTKNGHLMYEGILSREPELSSFSINDANGKRYLITTELLKDQELTLRRK